MVYSSGSAIMPGFWNKPIAKGGFIAVSWKEPRYHQGG